MLSFNINAQIDTVFTQEQIIRIGNYVDSLEKTNTILLKERVLFRDEINNLAFKADYLNKIRLQDSMLLGYKQDEITLLEQSIERHKDMNNLIKKKWYDKPIIWFMAGVGMVYLSSEIISNVK